MEKRKNYNGIDVVKLLMALCVVAIHLTPFAMFGENVSFLFDKVLTRANTINVNMSHQKCIFEKKITASDFLP